MEAGSMQFADHALEQQRATKFAEVRKEKIRRFAFKSKYRQYQYCIFKEYWENTFEISISNTLHLKVNTNDVYLLKYTELSIKETWTVARKKFPI